MENRKYAIIYQSLDLDTREPIVTVLEDVVIGNGFEAVGRAYTLFSDRIDALKERKENYEVIREYKELDEEDERDCFVWEIKEQDFIETWMLLEKREDN